MDFSRFLLCALLLVFSSFSLAKISPDTIGIALVHGTNDHRSDADSDYWKKEFVDKLTSVLSNPGNFVIVGCDYSQYMWHEDSAGCTADQLLAFSSRKNINKLIIYTHSHGANVIRWILSNPTYDPRFMLLSKKVAEVIAIAPSSGGTQLADEVFDGSLFSESLGWLIGYRNHAVKQQRIGDMALYNNELLFGTPGRPSLPVPFRVIVGTDVTASPFSGASYCNGYRLNAGLKFTQLYLDNCSDGFLTCQSQATAGNIWFHDIDKTEEKTPLSHNQSRHNCFGLEKMLTSDLAQKGVSQ